MFPVSLSRHHVGCEIKLFSDFVSTHGNLPISLLNYWPWDEKWNTVTSPLCRVQLIFNKQPPVSVHVLRKILSTTLGILRSTEGRESCLWTPRPLSTLFRLLSPHYFTPHCDVVRDRPLGIEHALFSKFGLKLLCARVGICGHVWGFAGTCVYTCTRFCVCRRVCLWHLGPCQAVDHIFTLSYKVVINLWLNIDTPVSRL